MEKWDLYTRERELIGTTHIRGEEIPADCYHLVVHVWIRNSKGEYLISQRAANRASLPLMWECVGGSVLAGETSLDGAIREVKEEVGVDLDPKSGQPVFSRVREQVNGERFADILDVWLFHYDGAVMLESATTDEVAQCQWMPVQQIRALADSGKLVPTLNYFFTEIHNTAER